MLMNIQIPFDESIQRLLLEIEGITVYSYEYSMTCCLLGTSKVLLLVEEIDIHCCGYSNTFVSYKC